MSDCKDRSGAAWLQKNSQMKKTLLTGIAALFLAIGAAHAGSRPQVAVGKPRIITTTVKGALYPPPKYDKPYEGELELRFFSDTEYVERICKLGPKVYGCAAKMLDGKKCYIFVISEAAAKKTGRNFAFMLRHELAHCNGWKHPEDANGRRFKVGEKWEEAEGATFLPIGTKKTMPKFPEVTRILPASPPVVCVTPEWKSEPCKNRSAPAVVAEPTNKVQILKVKPVVPE